MKEREGTGVPEEEFAAMMARIERAAPLLRAFSGTQGSADEAQDSPRRALLYALKPYLSPARCEAADCLLRLWQVGEVIKTVTKGE